MQSLLLEWKSKLHHLQGRIVPSIYFGGGTPTLFGDDRLKILLRMITKEIIPSTNLEITIEANPETLTRESLTSLREMGINRLSIGVQSLDSQLLQILGRNHTCQTIEKILVDACDVGFSNISIDIMYEIPKQNWISWEKTVQKTLTLPITHISLYNLTFEKGTPFHRNYQQLKTHLPSAEEGKKMLEYAAKTWEASGLKRYEISAFAKQEKYQSQHNLGYWTGRLFLGLGPSAYGYMDGERMQNTFPLKCYAKALHEGNDPVHFREQLQYPSNMRELLAIHLRIRKGVSLDTFQKTYGIDEETEKTILSLLKRGWLERSGKYLRLTEEGMLFYDSLAVELI